MTNDNGIGEFAGGHQVAFDQGYQISVYVVRASKSAGIERPTLEVNLCHGELIGWQLKFGGWHNVDESS